MLTFLSLTNFKIWKATGPMGYSRPKGYPNE